jgi:hypothetical protein
MKTYVIENCILHNGCTLHPAVEREGALYFCRIRIVSPKGAEHGSGILGPYESRGTALKRAIDYGITQIKADVTLSSDDA